MPDYDVLIAGYGPSGAMAANLLAQHNIRTLIVDPSHEVYDVPRGVHFDGETMRIFQSIGIADKIFADCSTVETLNFVNGQNEMLMHVPMRELPELYGWPADIFFRQPLIEKQLRENLSDAAHIEQRLGWSLEAMSQDDDGVEVTLRHGETGAEESVRTRYVIGADGADSRVRTLSDIALSDLQCDEPWLVVDWDLEPGVSFNRDVYQFCDPARPKTLVPCAGQHIRWEFMVNPGDDLEALEREENVRAMMAPYLHYLSPDIQLDQGEIIRSKVYQLHALLATRFRDDRVFIIGDAAHQMPPFLGQGMCAGMRDAAALVWRLAGVLDGTYRESILDSYESERRAHVRAVIKQAVRTGDIIQSRHRVKAFLRDTVLRLGKIFPVLISGVEFGAVWRLGKGLLGKDKASGYPIVQPFVSQNGGPSQRLDELLGDGFCVVSLSPEHASALQQTASAFPEIDCRIVSLGGRVTAEDTSLAELAKKHKADGFLVRPDRQIYASLRGDAAAQSNKLQACLADVARHYTS